MKKLSLMVFWLFLWLGSVFAYDDVSFEVLVTSEKGAYINQWETQVFSSEESSKIQASKNSYDEAVFFAVTDPTQLQTPLQFVFESGEGKLAKGEYDNATRHPFNPDEFPGIDISGNGRWCNEVIGRFDVQYIKRDGDKIVSAFILFEHYCEKNADQWLYGYIAYNTDDSKVENLYNAFWADVESMIEDEGWSTSNDAYIDALFVDFVENLVVHIQEWMDLFIPQYNNYCEISIDYENFVQCDLPKSLVELDKRIAQGTALRTNIGAKLGIDVTSDEVDMSFFTDTKKLEQELTKTNKQLTIATTFGKTLAAIQTKIQKTNNQRVKDIVTGMQYTNYLRVKTLEETKKLLTAIIDYLQ